MTRSLHRRKRLLLVCSKLKSVHTTGLVWSVLLLRGISILIVVLHVAKLLLGPRIFPPIVLSWSWCSAFTSYVSHSTAVETSSTISGLVICSIAMPTWWFFCVVSILLLVWWTAFVIFENTVLIFAAVFVTIVLIFTVSFNVLLWNWLVSPITMSICVCTPSVRSQTIKTNWSTVGACGTGMWRVFSFALRTSTFVVYVVWKAATNWSKFGCATVSVV